MKPPTKTDLFRALAEAARHKSPALQKLIAAERDAEETLLRYEDSNPTLQKHRAAVSKASQARAKQGFAENRLRNNEIGSLRIRLHMEGVTVATIKAVKDVIRKLTR